MKISAAILAALACPFIFFFAEYFFNYGDDAYQRELMNGLNSIASASFILGILGLIASSLSYFIQKNFSKNFQNSMTNYTIVFIIFYILYVSVEYGKYIYSHGVDFFIQSLNFPLYPVVVVFVRDCIIKWQKASRK
jgi:hypothetical protein